MNVQSSKWRYLMITVSAIFFGISLIAWLFNAHFWPPLLLTGVPMVLWIWPSLLSHLGTWVQILAYIAFSLGLVALNVYLFIALFRWGMSLVSH